MNLFLLLLVVCVTLKVSLYVATRLFAWIKAGFPDFCRAVFIKTRALWKSFTAWRRGTTGVKELNRNTTLRCRISHYIAQLEKGDHPHAQELWRLYLERVPEHYRHIDTENGGLHPLPRWMEQLSSVMSNPLVVAAFKFLALYMVMLTLLSCFTLVMNNTETEPLLLTRNTLKELLDLWIEPCVSSSIMLSRTLCFLHRYDVLNVETLESLSNRTVHLTASSRIKPNQSLDVLIDEHDSVYYPLDFIVPSNKAWLYNIGEDHPSESQWFGPSPPSLDEMDSLETIQLRRYVNTEKQMAPFLTALHREAANTCICALFLNIVSNVSFMYDTNEARWLVMRDANILRNNSFAELVESRITYNERSRFFNKHKQWQTLVNEELIHYDSFVIEYDTLEEDEESEDSRGEMKIVRVENDKLRDNAYTKASLYKRTRHSTRKQVAISGSEAICFVYCETLNRAYIHKKLS